MSDVQTVTLTEFLLARIAEDEASAHAATDGPWTDTPMGSEGSIVRAGGNTIHTARKPATCREFTDAAHIARHDPARVLAECEAKRRIVELHHDDQPYCALNFSAADHGYFEGPCDNLRLLALPYADHLDYREEWKP